MDIETRAELLTLRALLLLTLGELANLRPDSDRFLGETRRELIRALGSVRIEPVSQQPALRARAVAFAEDWFTHIHFKDDDTPPPLGH
ncbi:MAG TPA: hypothetical protein VIJ94_08400 [Caulobacteraceae bacterium]